MGAARGRGRMGGHYRRSWEAVQGRKNAACLPRIRNDTEIIIRQGNPDQDRICTSHAERSNRTLRMQIRRMTRLTDAHSKKLANHTAAMALFVCYYNFSRVHETLAQAARENGDEVRKVTPAMAAGLTDHVWSVAELLAAIASPVS